VTVAFRYAVIDRTIRSWLLSLLYRNLLNTSHVVSGKLLTAAVSQLHFLAQCVSTTLQKNQDDKRTDRIVLYFCIHLNTVCITLNNALNSNSSIQNIEVEKKLFIGRVLNKNIFHLLQ